ncbi:hypothetical protein [Nocardioides xinjiangensis]|uniref:hypothetical protein n=1 Tax=Nocardioides xinjiangensis TaxID=2817376 RepID=UPI001B30AC8F|nr:hypothetical protein [Nocardioides sp. SYSU D00778]
MTTVDVLRNSRDGDQFHYTWAARQALRLLNPYTDLRCLYVEAVDPSESGGTDAGEEVIDLAEYWGSAHIEETTRVVYRQFKHSTAHPDDPWTLSFLSKTLLGFARKFGALAAAHPSALDRAEFEFVTNRPIADSAVAALTHLRHGTTSAAVERLRTQLEELLSPAEVQQFCSQLSIDQRAPSLFQLRHLLDEDLADRLPGAPGDEALRLREMIATRATNIDGSRPKIRRQEVLAALKTSDDLLFPAPNLIAQPSRPIVRTQFRQILETISGESGHPIVIHGPGGVGKSVLASVLAESAPQGSLTITFDCYGNGSYRRPSRQRHQPKQGLVQVINEIASKALCLPIIPSATATDRDYFDAFVRRIDKAAEALAATTADALLTVVIDAADNAAMMAKEVDEQSFVRGLVREVFASNVRLVLTCRTERLDELALPSSYRGIAMDGYTLDETRAILNAAYEGVEEPDVREFHRRTSRNPRVQSTVMAATETLDEALAWLGPDPASPQDALEAVIARQVAEIRDGVHLESHEIDKICVGLSALRPMIPVRVLAELAEVHEAVVHSFVADLGRPLLLLDGAVQFRDEPTETWFRTRYRPTGTALDAFLERLMPLARDDAYVSSAVPALLFEAGRFEDLVELAMSDDALPDNSLPADERNSVQRREIAQQRAQFALRAALKRDDDYSAALLALRVGTLNAGRTRRLRLIRENTDIAPRYIDAQVLEHLLSMRSIGSDWLNSHIVYEGALLASMPGQSDQARNQLRSASSWMSAWTRQAVRDGEQSGVSDYDISQVAWGLACTDGAAASIRFLRGWRPKEVAFEAGVHVLRRLADAGRLEEIREFARCARGRHLRFAVAQVCSERGLSVDVVSLRNLLKPLLGATTVFQPSRRNDESWATNDQFVHGGLTAASWIVIQALRAGLIDVPTAKRIIRPYVPPNLGHHTGGWSDRDIWAPIAVLALSARLDGRLVGIDEIQGTRIAEARAKQKHVYSSDLRDFDANVKPLAWWADLWVRLQIQPTEADVDEFREGARTFLAQRHPGRRDDDSAQTYLNVALPLILRIATEYPDALEVGDLNEFWIDNRPRLWRGTRIRLVREAARCSKFHAFAHEVAERCYEGTVAAQEDAQGRSDDLVALARAVYTLSAADSAAYFQSALTITDAIGDDAWARWGTFVRLAPLAADGTESHQRAYRLGQVAEGLEPYLGDGLNHVDALVATAALSVPEALALGSRWRDRRFAPIGRLIAALAKSEQGLRADEVVALLPLCDSYLDDDELASGLAFESGTELSTVAALLRHRRSSPLRQDAFETLLRRSGVTRSQIQQADPSLRFDYEDRPEPVSDRSYTSRFEPGPSPTFDDIDFRTPEGWAAALDRASGLHRELVFEHLVETGQLRAEVFAAFAANPDMNRFDLDALVSAVGDRRLSLGSRGALDQAYVEGLSRVAVDNLLVAWRKMDYARMRVQTGRSTDYEHIASRALVALNTFDAEQAYALAGHLAQRLSVDKAQDLFDAAADLFLDCVPLDFGDGHHPNGMASTESTASALAATIWTALGDPAIATRWRAAHSVHLVLELHLVEVTDALIELAGKRKDASSYLDSRLGFYDRHARQWLLFGLRRASVDENALSSLRRFAPWLRETLTEPSHAINAPLARDILLQLHSSGYLDGEPTETNALVAIGKPTQVVRNDHRSPARSVSSFGELDWPASAPTPTESDEDENDEEPHDDSFRFFMDFGPYWCNWVGDAFNLTERSVERLVEEVLLQDWRVTSRGRIEDDPRYTHELYRRNSHPRKTDWPEEEDLDFYLSVQALYEVAGRLLERLPVQDRYSDDETTDANDYTRFLDVHMPTRVDGRWVADRRDAPPFHAQLRSDIAIYGAREKSDLDWTFEIASAMFEREVFRQDGRVAVSVTRDVAGSSRRESVRVSSALVSPPTAHALLRALQTAPDKHAYRLPEVNDREFELTNGAFKLIGWIESRPERSGQDRHDPLAGDIAYPPDHPGQLVDGLFPSEDMRAWYDEHGAIAMTSLVWSELNDSNSSRGTSGEELLADSAWLGDQLKRLDRWLIVEVEIRRRCDDSPSGFAMREDDENIGYLMPYTKYYLIDSDGGVHEQH